MQCRRWAPRLPRESASDPKDLDRAFARPVVERATLEAPVNGQAYLTRGIKTDIIDRSGVRLTENVPEVPE